jgi:hypothetical protein
MKKTKRDYQAKLTLYGLNKMSDRELNILFKWLVDTADQIDLDINNEKKFVENPVFRLMK